MSASEGVSTPSPPQTNGRLRRVSSRARKLAEQIRCAVSSCSSFQGKKTADGSEIRFFSLPRQNATRERWIKAVPELEFMETVSTQKVCQLHFMGGAPSAAFSFPCLSLDDDGEKKENKKTSSQKSHAGKGSPECIELGDSPSPPSEIDGDGVPPAKKRSLMDILSTDRCQPISLPSVSNKPPNGGHVGAKPLEDSDNASATSFIRSSDGNLIRVKRIKAFPGTGSPMRVVRTTTSHATNYKFLNRKLASAPAVTTAPLQPRSSALTATTATTATASVPVVESSSADVSEKAVEKSPVPAPEPMTLMDALHRIAKVPPTQPEVVQVEPSTSKAGEAAVVARQSAIKNRTATAAKESGCPSTTTCKTDACPNCLASLPVLRRSLGRLESQMESMTDMVRSIVAHLANQKPAQSSTGANGVSAIKPKPSTSMPFQYPVVVVQSNSVKLAVPRTKFVPALQKRPAVKPNKPRYTISNSMNSVPGSATAVVLDDMKEMASRAILSHCSRSFSIDELLQSMPYLKKKVPVNVLEIVLKRFVSFGALLRIDGDSSLSFVDKDAMYEKSDDQSIMEPLLKSHNISVDTYKESLNS